MKWPLTSLNAVFANQMNALIKLGYPKSLGMTDDAFQETLQPLRNQLSRVIDIDIPENHLPFIIVFTDEILSIKNRLAIMPGYWEECIVDCHKEDLVSVVSIPPASCYLAVDIEDGTKTKFQYPEMGTVSVSVPKRSCLTVDEGISLVSQRHDLLSRRYSIFLGGSRYNWFNQKNEIPYLAEYDGEFDEGIALYKTVWGRPLLLSGENKESWWGTPTCQFRISAVDADYKTEMLPLYRRDRIVLEHIAIHTEAMSLTLPTLETIVHASMEVFAELMSWHKQGYRVICKKGDCQTGGIHLGGLPHHDLDCPQGDRPIQVTWSKQNQETLEVLVRECDAQDYITVIRYAIHTFYEILSNLNDSHFYMIVKRGEEPQKVDLLANLPR